jgi:hypothetical protein
MGYVRVKLQLMRVTTMNISINDEKQHGVVEFSWLSILRASHFDFSATQKSPFPRCR